MACLLLKSSFSCVFHFQYAAQLDFFVRKIQQHAVHTSECFSAFRQLLNSVAIFFVRSVAVMAGFPISN